MRTQETAQAERLGEGLAHRGGVLRGLIQDPANGLRGIPLPKPSEKPWTHQVRSLTGHRKRFISAHCDLRALPNPQSERYSHPFSDSFSTHSGE